MTSCSEAPCPAPAVVIYTARGGTTATHRAATACHTHRRTVRAWVAGAGPTVQEHPLDTAPENAGLLF
jgi:hypothetical protein